MGDISNAIRKLIEGFRLDTGTAVTTPSESGIESNKTTSEVSVSNVEPIEKDNCTNEIQEKKGPIVNISSDLCHPFSHLDVSTATIETEIETETNKVPEIATKTVKETVTFQKAASINKQLETNLEKKIEGSDMSTRSLPQNSYKGVGLGKPRVPIQKSKKRNITNIISDILGLSDDAPTSSASDFNQSNFGAFRTATLGANPGNPEIEPKSKKRNITNIISDILGLSDDAPTSTANDFNQSNFGAFRTATLGANPGNPEIEPSNGTMDKPTGFSSAKICLESKTPQNGTEIQKQTNNLEKDEFRNKRVKNEKSSSFLSGVNILGMQKHGKGKTATNSIYGNKPICQITPDLSAIAAETFSGFADFSPVKFSNQKPQKDLNQTYDMPINVSEIGTGTILSSTMRQEIPTNQKLDDAFSDADILNLTFSDISQHSQSNQEKIAECETGTETNENDITLTQFLTQYPANITPSLATGNMYINRNHNLETSFKGANQILNENSFLLEMSKTYNQTKLELELRELISEPQIETMDSSNFSPRPPVRPTNQNSPYYTQYLNLDIFTPLQENNISSPKLPKPELTHLETGTMTESVILADESSTNFDDSHVLNLESRSGLRIILGTPSTKDASHSPIPVAKETPNNNTSKQTNKSFDFSHLTDIINFSSPVRYNSAPLECHTPLEFHT